VPTHASPVPVAPSPAVRVQVGIDAAIVAQHQVCVRAVDVNGRVSTHRFRVQPTLAGLTSLGKQLSAYPGVVAVAEPTSMTWLGLSIAVTEAGGQFALLGSRHAARLRGAISGKNKTDVIDADVLARAGEVFELTPLRLPSPAELALRRLCVRRGAAVIDANRYLRRLLSLARWAFPDVWNAFEGSLPTARAVLGRWPHLAQLACSRRAALTAVVAEHTRGVADVPERVEAIRSNAAAWARFWTGRLDLDALAFDVTEHLTDLTAAEQRVARVTEQARQYWERLYGDDPLLNSIPGVGPITGPTIRAYLGDGSLHDSAKDAASYVGITPSNWSSGTVVQPNRAITKEGPPVLRLAFYQAANVARSHDPQLAEFYYRLMVHRGHTHTQACVAVARKLVERTWTVLRRAQPYQLRDLDGNPITQRAAKQLIKDHYTVDQQTRARARAHTAATKRSKTTR
jgi:Transposase and inactivated derivatives